MNMVSIDRDCASVPSVKVAGIVPLVSEAALPLGYVLTVRRATSRGYDFIACPWVRDAASAEDLAEEIRSACGGYFASNLPEQNSHGRRTWTIQLEGGQRVVLGVMPCLPAPQLQFPRLFTDWTPLQD